LRQLHAVPLGDTDVADLSPGESRSARRRGRTKRAIGAATRRLAVVSTPRAGTTWLRHLMTRTMDVPGFAVDDPLALDWAALPEGCVVSLHGHRSTDLLQQLGACDFRVVVLARHPLDTLISVLHFAMYSASSTAS